MEVQVMRGKTSVINGAGPGIGYETVMSIARLEDLSRRSGYAGH
jgi:short-subunit dehydrogenase